MRVEGIGMRRTQCFHVEPTSTSGARLRLKPTEQGSTDASAVVRRMNRHEVHLER